MVKKNNSKIQKKKEKNFVLIFSMIMTIFIIFIGIVFPKNFNLTIKTLFNKFISQFSPIYLILMLMITIFCIFIAFSKYGNIKLGKDDDKPEFSNVVWFAMLFGAGMGIGLVFFGAYEPLCHFTNPVGVMPGSKEAVRFSIQQSFIHWGVQPWAAYCLIGLCLGYFQFRKEEPGLISSTLNPVLDNRKFRKNAGIVVDTLTVFTTVIGVAASLGLGTMQIGSGIEFIFGIENTVILKILIVAVVAIIYISSAVSGLNNGMKKLSNINLILATILLVGCFLVGPVYDIIKEFFIGIGNYVKDFIPQSLGIGFSNNKEWLNNWRVFYWAFWISWTPFVGIFIARISKGRTIREFVLGVTVLPAIISLAWFTIFGVMGMDLGLDFAKDAIMITETSLFKVLSHYTFGTVFSIIAIILLFTFFITSANSSIYVLAMFTSKGNLNPDNKKKVLWGILQALFAITLILSGGLDTLQKLAIIVSFPFAIIMLLMMYSILKSLKKDLFYKEEAKKLNNTNDNINT